MPGAVAVGYTCTPRQFQTNIHAHAKDSNACMNYRCAENMHVAMAMGGMFIFICTHLKYVLSYESYSLPVL